MCARQETSRFLSLNFRFPLLGIVQFQQHLVFGTQHDYLSKVFDFTDMVAI